MLPQNPTPEPPRTLNPTTLHLQLRRQERQDAQPSPGGRGKGGKGGATLRDPTKNSQMREMLKRKYVMGLETPGERRRGRLGFSSWTGGTEWERTSRSYADCHCAVKVHST